MLIRPRRNRKNAAMRSLVRETVLRASDLIWPCFLVESSEQESEIKSMPGVYRLTTESLLTQVEELVGLGVGAIALFPALEDSLKTPDARESWNEKGLLQRAVRTLKKNFPEVVLITDVAMDPYSSDGHDGVVKDGRILNDETLPILAKMALSQAQAGADMVAPSDMMDGRIGFIRDVLDNEGFTDVSIMAYSAKYASAFYGPFRDALDSAPKSGDKKTYQMDPANVREALLEVELDIQEGADVVMVKPAMAYLDVIAQTADCSPVPVAAYQVSGEYAMLKAASQLGWLDEEQVVMESLLAIKRAGSDMILTYFAPQVARWLRR